MGNNKILIISGCKYPEGDAGSVRIHSLAKLFELCGRQVVVIGKGPMTSKRENYYDGIQYFSFRGKSNHFAGKIVDRLNNAKKTKDFLGKYGKDFSHILIVDIPFNSIDLVVKYAKENDIILLHDSLEWYSPSEFQLGKFDLQYIHRDILNKKKITSDFRVIAISKYLQTYFENKGCSVIRIPAILGPTPDRKPNEINDKVIITYAGLPERKDKLTDILDAYCELNQISRNKLELRIIGITLAQLARRYSLSSDKITEYEQCVIFYGRIPRNEVIQKLRETHFTIFYRDASERYAKAGFPTKVAESTANGIPVITNYSSDLEEYLVDGYNSIIIKETEKSGIKCALEKASKLTSSEYMNMSVHSKDTFDSSFCYIKYSNEVSAFLGV